MNVSWVAIAGALLLGGCAARDAVATAERPLLSVETRLACAVDNAPAETSTRGPRRGYDGEAMPSVPAPASADGAIDGVVPRRSCASNERLAALMLAMPEVTASVDASGAVALIEADAPAPRRPAADPARRVAMTALPPPANRAAEAAARLAQAATGRVRPPR